MSRPRVPIRTSIDFKVLLAFGMALSAVNFGQGQTGAPRTASSEVPWKSMQLAELAAQTEWLNSWTEGSLTNKPQTTFQLPKLRIEPILKSNLATELRKQLNWENTEQDERDFEILKRALSDHPSDIGLQQLHLHWMDLPIRRKGLLSQIEVSAVRLIATLKAQGLTDPNVRLATEFAMYRRARALAYRELPDVAMHTPIDNPQRLNEDILSAYQELVDLGGKGHPEFILIEIRMIRRSRFFGTALCLLEKYGSVIKPQWYLKKRRDLLKELGWEIPHAEAAAIYASEFPDAVAKEADLDHLAPPGS